LVLANARLLDRHRLAVLLGHSIDWRGALTVQTIARLLAHGRIQAPH
jgi:hypothetical protein